MNFKVGDVCEVVHVMNPDAMKYIGTQCTVVEVRFGLDDCPYRVSCALDGSSRWWAGACCLRKVEPPNEHKREQLGDWDLYPWQPPAKIPAGGMMTSEEVLDTWHVLCSGYYNATEGGLE